MSDEENVTDPFELTPKQTQIIRRFRKVVADAREAGLYIFADAEAWGARIMPASAIGDDTDPREHGDVVNFDSGCGTPSQGNVAVM